MKMLKRDDGFTLIEVIVSVIIIGIITSFAGMAIVTGVKGYVFTRDSASTGQKAQLAMTRISRELMEITTVTTGDASRITYERLDDSGASITQTIYADDETVKIASGSAAVDGDTLVDSLGSFTLAYYKGADSWVVADGIASLTAIEIALGLTWSDGSEITFSTTVSPRNTGS